MATETATRWKDRYKLLGERLGGDEGTFSGGCDAMHTVAGRKVVWRVPEEKARSTSKSIESIRPCETPWYL